MEISHSPSTVRQVDQIELEDSSLHLPDTIKSVGKLEIWYGDSVFGHSGVERFGEVVLHQVDFEFSDGVREIENLDASTSSLRFPTTMRKIGNIRFTHDYDDVDTIEWPEGTIEVDDICMVGPTKIRLPKSVRAVGAVNVGQRACLDVALDTRILGRICVQDGGQFTRY